MTPENVALLAREYYTFNEWSISALRVLSREMSELGEERRRVVAVCSRKLENFLVGLGGDEVPLEAVDWTALSHFESDAVRGKALFLDTMGFANAEIMAGALHESDVDLVAESSRGRLRPRHHALARLAREGLLPTVVTTNYDLLLEGAYRLAGFQERKDSVPASSDSLALLRASRSSGSPSRPMPACSRTATTRGSSRSAWGWASHRWPRSRARPASPPRPWAGVTAWAHCSLATTRTSSPSRRIPLADISELERVQFVMKGGVVHKSP